MKRNYCDVCSAECELDAKEYGGTSVYELSSARKPGAVGIQLDVKYRIEEVDHLGGRQWTVGDVCRDCLIDALTNGTLKVRPGAFRTTQVAEAAAAMFGGAT